MGRAMRWLKKVLTGKKEGDKEHNAAASHGGIAPLEKRRWSFAKPRNSVADGSRRPSVTAVVAGELLQVRPCNCVQEREVEAAVMIQKAFRGYLARKALRALKSLVKLQALVRGYLVRKQAATTLHRLQALMRLQASSHALKNAPSRKSIEQVRIFRRDAFLNQPHFIRGTQIFKLFDPFDTKERTSAQEAQVKPLSLPVVHRRRLSDGGDSNFERSPRIVEMDTCQLRCRSSRITSRYAADTQDGLPGSVPLSSPLLYFYKPPSSRLQEHEPRYPKTTQNTPRLSVLPGYYGSPAKGRQSCRESSSPRYMADTASSVARTRCQNTPRQRHGAHAHAAAPAEPRPSLARAGSRKARPQLQDSLSFKSSEASRVEDHSEFSDEVTRDYYLDRLW